MKGEEGGDELKGGRGKRKGKGVNKMVKEIEQINTLYGD